ncbi:zinc finger protein 277 isoform X1 [Neodiprion virginianus]|uniref:zinc finger protein 277 isoform X1 n=2 Tax=Neodiprion virginianus TaxID=2961670 RepID=UPI001EE6F0F8|nr:zinc finger protein 277 isoform X1 [Neodiprion virginianus]
MAERVMNTGNFSHMFGPLNFPTCNSSKCKSQFIELDDRPQNTRCLLCEETYLLPNNQQQMLTHIFTQHRLVIGDVEKIASLKSYIHYWRVKLSEAPLTQFCTSLLMDCTPDGKPSKNEPYFLLSDCVAEDKTVRFEIQQAKLEWVLAQQDKERADTSFKRGCMFCRTEFSGSRNSYLQHLSRKHNLQLGRPENLVFVDELLDMLQNNVEKLICFYCEGVFKDRNTLKEHMRKKLHKTLNPADKKYDKFYVINYLEPDRNSQQKQNCVDDSEDPTGFTSGSDDGENAWSDWDGESVDAVCLFCPYNNRDFANILSHMISKHQFNFEEVTKDCDFYQRVKIVNFVRRQIHIQKKCVFCDEAANDLGEHMSQLRHCKLPARRVWDQPEYYFPTYENDSFLYNLEVSGGDNQDSDTDNLSAEMSNL